VVALRIVDVSVLPPALSANVDVPPDVAELASFFIGNVHALSPIDIAARPSTFFDTMEALLGINVVALGIALFFSVNTTVVVVVVDT
jgi:hypothetical protein